MLSFRGYGSRGQSVTFRQGPSRGLSGLTLGQSVSAQVSLTASVTAKMQVRAMKASFAKGSVRQFVQPPSLLTLGARRMLSGPSTM